MSHVAEREHSVLIIIIFFLSCMLGHWVASFSIMGQGVQTGSLFGFPPDFHQTGLGLY
jgi:hypothetical protein